MLGKRYIHHCAIDAWVGNFDDFISDASLHLTKESPSFENLSKFLNEKNLSLPDKHLHIYFDKNLNRSEYETILSRIDGIIQKNHSFKIPYLRRITFAFFELKYYEEFLEILYETISE